VPSGQVVTRRWARVALVAGIVAFATYYGITAVVAHDRFNTFTFDLGIFDQGMWLMSRFKSPFISLIGRHLFGDHTSFILVTLVPLYWVGASAKVLLVVQAVLLGLSAWPLFLIARDLLRDERIAAVLSTAFLLQPALSWAARDQFHPDVFEVPLLLFALWFMLRRRWVGFFVFVGLALLVKEDVPLLTLVLGLYVAVRYSRKVGLATAALSALYFAFAVYVVLRHFNGVGTLNTWRVPFGGPGGLLSTTFTDPGEVIGYVVGEGRPWYLWQMLAPLALVPLLAPGTMLIAAGPILGNLLSNFWYQHSIKYHYQMLILPVLALAAAVGLSRFANGRARAVLSAVALAAAIAGAALWGPPLADPYYGGYSEAPSPAAIQAALEAVPPDAVVSAYFRYTTHLDHREAIYALPNPFRASYWGIGDSKRGQRLPEADTVQYVIVPAHALNGEIDKGVVEELRRDFEVIHDSGGVLVFRRVEASG
jgi:uncharacterized membrane protein